MFVKSEKLEAGRQGVFFLLFYVLFFRKEPSMFSMTATEPVYRRQMSLYTVYLLSCRHDIISGGIQPDSVYTRARGKKKEVVDFQRLPLGGDSWTRTNDPIDVNDVLYRLSHAT